MAITTSTSTSQLQEPSLASKILEGVYEVSVSAGAGALAGYLFTIINPVGGAIFGATMDLTRLIGDALADKFLMDQTSLKIAAYVVSLIVAAGAGFLVTTALGFPITVLGTIGMVITMAITSFAIRILFHGAGCCSSCLGGLGLALKERC